METNQNTRDGRRQSIWQKNVKVQPPGQAFSDERSVFDTLVVGAGITGLTTALLLQKAGKRCIIAEAHNPGYGTTGGTSAHINTFADTTYAEVEQDFSADAAQQFSNSIAEAVQLIHDHVGQHEIDCDFEWKRGFVYAQTGAEVKELDDILKSSLKVGVNVRETNRIPIPVDFNKAIVFDQQAQFHPLKYLNGLQRAFEALGGIILSDTLINDITTADGIHTAVSGHNTPIRSRSVVYATHIPPGGVNLLHFRNAPYRSYVIAATLAHDNAYPEDLIYDMQDPYHYFRTHVIDGQKYLVAGGHDHKTGHGSPEQSFEDLIQFARQYFPVREVAHQWSAQYYVPSDGLPYIGQLPGAGEGIFTATGFNGNGMILGTAAAIVLSDLIIHGESKYRQLYDPARVKPIAGFTEFVKENADVATRFVADRFGLEQVDSVVQLARDSGEIVEYEGQKLAIYKDRDGQVQALDPVCTHAKCIVNWNGAEKSWDCPCHGARFDTDGTVLTGPARKNLRRIQLNL